MAADINMNTNMLVYVQWLFLQQDSDPILSSFFWAKEVLSIISLYKYWIEVWNSGIVTVLQHYMLKSPQRFPTEDHLMIHRHKHEMTLKFSSIKNDNMLSGELRLHQYRLTHTTSAGLIL